MVHLIYSRYALVTLDKPAQWKIEKPTKKKTTRREGKQRDDEDEQKSGEMENGMNKKKMAIKLTSNIM